NRVASNISINKNNISVKVLNIFSRRRRKMNFFFQAEDGIRDRNVTGVQTCALPISFTIGLDTIDRMREKVLEASSYPVLKIKLGTDRDEAILRMIRDATDKPLRVDANAGWTRERALQMLPVLREYGVEFVEQPLPSDD